MALATIDLSTAFLLGLVGSLHCAGMCGPLALALPATGNTTPGYVLGRLAYNAGRIITYCALGIVFGLAGWTFLLAGLQRWVSIALGVAVLAIFQPGGWRVFATVMVRTNLCLLTMILLSNTTPFADVLRVLQRVRVPPLLVTTLALMYRYLFVLADEVGRMGRARASRTFSPQRGVAWRSLAGIVSQLFIRSTERAERIYAAMCARGWQ